MKTIKAYECMDAVSLDKGYLNKLADGKGEVSEVVIEVTEEVANELNTRNNNTFNFATYEELLENNEEEATEYFEDNAKCINVTIVENITYL